MKTRALWYALFVGVVSMTSGCCCFRETFPHVGWRFHQGASCSPCAPACSPGPAFRPAGVGGPDCPSCAAGGPPVSFTQPVGYPPEIGQPVPLPGPKVVPGTELPNPMPVNPKTGN